MNIEAIDEIIQLPDGKMFIQTVVGDCMKKHGIENNNHVVIERKRKVKKGEIVVFTDKEQYSGVKLYSGVKKGKKIFSSGAGVIVDVDNKYIIYGVVKYILKKV